MTGIYKITNTINNKCYIGKSEVDIIYRLNQHKNGKESNEHLQHSIQKYGIENFTFEILEECSKEKCCEREKYWIEYYNSLYPNGYNYTTGGENQSGFHFSEHSKQKMSQSAKKRCSTDIGRQKMSEKAKKRVWTDSERESVSNTLKEKYKDKSNVPMYGKKHTEETKEKMSQQRKGSNHWNYGKHLTNETKYKKSISIKGRKWVNNGIEQKQIIPDELNLYLSKGYKLGMLPKNK